MGFDLKTIVMFHEDLKLAHNLEANVARFFDGRGYQTWLNPEKNADYDVGIYDGSTQTLIECKMDWGSLYTGNFCLERPTLEKTKADYFLLATPSCVLLTRNQAQALFDALPKKLVGDYSYEAVLPRKSAVYDQGIKLYEFGQKEKNQVRHPQR